MISADLRGSEVSTILPWGRGHFRRLGFTDIAKCNGHALVQGDMSSLSEGVLELD